MSRDTWTALLIILVVVVVFLAGRAVGLGVVSGAEAGICLTGLIGGLMIINYPFGGSGK